MPDITDETDTKKKRARTRFLNRLADGYSVTASARYAGYSRQSMYRWRDEDEDFAAAWDDAWESRGDWYEDQNRKQAAAGHMAAVLNGLRMHNRVKDRHEITGANNSPFYVVMRGDLPSDIYGNGGSDTD